MLNILIPMAGRGSRFLNAGYIKPKPLIDVNGKPMIQLVIENIRPKREHRFIFVVQNEHIQDYKVDKLLKNLCPTCEIVVIDGITDGAACSSLKAITYINNKDPLMIANSDQWINISIDDYLEMWDVNKSEGFIMTMYSSDPKWSYIKFDPSGIIIDIVEKVVVSNQATVGIYNFSRGDIFCQFAAQMIDEKNMSKGEYYVAPVYKYMLNNNANIGLFNIDRASRNMYGLGTPEDLDYFLNQFQS